jgi:SNF2 family DNA or RNA helicase
VVFLTGTPMENKVEEFKNLVDYLQPHLASYVHPRHGAAGPVAFRKAVSPVYLRRNQDDVLQELPDLARIDEWVEFTAHDAAAYRSAVAAGNFMAMRRAAYQAGNQSAKLARLVELVSECAANDRKVVIFSFFRDVLDLITATVGPAAFGPLTGATPAAQRQTLIDRFAAIDGHSVLISQIQAGGVGLNIQAASVAILCEPQLKPTTEDQAVARLHRMGQVRAVQVHRLLAANSADERLLELLATKSQLFDDYVRRSDIAEASPDAIDISDVELSRKIVELEQERMALDLLEATAGATGVE